MCETAAAPCAYALPGDAVAAVQFFQVVPLQPINWMSSSLHSLVLGGPPTTNTQRVPLRFGVRLAREAGSRRAVSATEVLLGDCGCSVVRVDVQATDRQRLHFVCVDDSVLRDSAVAKVMLASWLIRSFAS